MGWLWKGWVRGRVIGLRLTHIRPIYWMAQTQPDLNKFSISCLASNPYKLQVICRSSYTDRAFVGFAGQLRFKHLGHKRAGLELGRVSLLVETLPIFPIFDPFIWVKPDPTLLSPGQSSQAHIQPWPMYVRAGCWSGSTTLSFNLHYWACKCISFIRYSTQKSESSSDLSIHRP